VPADIILYALIAAGLVFWLKSLLGTKHGEERERQNPFTAAPVETAKRDQAAVIDAEEIIETGFNMLPRGASIENKTAELALEDLAKRDKNFDLAQFITNAQDAFALIVESFAKGDREMLKDLLSDKVYASFDAALTDRDSKGETVETEVHAIRKADVTEVRIEGNTASVTIRFTVDETCVIRNKDGIVLGGDPDRITEMKDVWTFARDIKSKDPRWLVTETRDGDLEEHKTPLPEAG
jgi:predicted lipid-binding transport protein (Tim44 family)